MLLIAAFIAFATIARAQCDSTYCSSQGTASINASGACVCACTPPAYGYRCIFSYANNASVNCADPYYSQSDVYCAAAGRTCFWNQTTSQCMNRTGTLSTGQTSETVGVPWCYNSFPLPLIMVVYAVATIAFGFCGVAILYFARYYDVFSRVEDSGERVFNQFYNSTAPYVTYSVFVVVSAGILAVTSWINLNNPDDCTYVSFVYIYILIQVFPFVVIPLYYLGVWIITQCRKSGDLVFVLDEHISPKTSPAYEDPMSNQVRCF